MKFSKAFKGSYFKAADLDGKPKEVIIKSVAEEDVGDETKVVLRFKDCDQALVLNKTNGGALAEAYGDDMDGWVGKPVVLKPDKTDFGGKRVDCVRVAVPSPDVPF